MTTKTIQSVISLEEIFLWHVSNTCLIKNILRRLTYEENKFFSKDEVELLHERKVFCYAICWTNGIIQNASVVTFYRFLFVLRIITEKGIFH